MLIHMDGIVMHEHPGHEKLLNHLTQTMRFCTVLKTAFAPAVNVTIALGPHSGGILRNVMNMHSSTSLPLD